MEITEQAINEINDHLLQMQGLFERVWATHVPEQDSALPPHEQAMRSISRAHAGTALDKAHRAFTVHWQDALRKVALVADGLKIAPSPRPGGEELITISWPSAGIRETGQVVTIGAGHYAVFPQLGRKEGWCQPLPQTPENVKTIEEALRFFVAWVLGGRWGTLDCVAPMLESYLNTYR